MPPPDESSAAIVAPAQAETGREPGPDDGGDAPVARVRNQGRGSGEE